MYELCLKSTTKNYEKENQGNQGIIGKIGIKGDQGNQGNDGDKGINGNDGNKGKNGNQGDQGIKGIKGNIGKIGKIGEIGIVGDRGDRGIIGDIGITGKIGEIGNKGSDIGFIGKSIVQPIYTFYSFDRKTYYPGESISFPIPQKIDDNNISNVNNTFILKNTGKYSVFFSLYSTSEGRVSIILNDKEVLKSICGTNIAQFSKTIQSCILNITKENSVLKIINCSNDRRTNTAVRSVTAFSLNKNTYGKQVGIYLKIKKLV